MPSGGSIPGGNRRKRKFRRFQAAIRLSAGVLPSHRSSPPRTLPRLAKDVFDYTPDDPERIRSERDIWRQPTKATEW